MPFGRLNGAQADAVRAHVAGKVVHDLGAGDLELAHQLVEFGAAEVVAVDKEIRGEPRSSRVRLLESEFRDLPRGIETVFCSWPMNWRMDIAPVLISAKTIIYLGSNFDGSACGGDDFWGVVTIRNILEHVPAYPNTLIVYGPRFSERALVPEEGAAMHRHSRMYRYVDAYDVPVEEAVPV